MTLHRLLAGTTAAGAFGALAVIVPGPAAILPLTLALGAAVIVGMVLGNRYPDTED